MIAACGLYCGACRKYRMGKCQGCNTSDTDNPALAGPLTSGLKGVRFASVVWKRASILVPSVRQTLKIVGSITI